MSFSRIKYDKSAYDLQMKRSTEPGNYRLYGPSAESCDSCFSYDGPIGAKSDVSLVKKSSELSFEKMVQVESDLSWRNNKLSKNNNGLVALDNSMLINKPSCSNKLTPEDTRFTHPINDFRSMSLTNLQVHPHLQVNPQCHVQELSNRLGMNSRLYAKDFYKIPAQEFIDNGEALPKNN